MEKALLGAILSGHKQTFEVLDLIKPADFFFQPHAAIVKAVLKLNAEGTKADLLSVHDALSISGEIESVGGIAYVAGLLDSKAISSDILNIVRGLRRMSAFRKAIHLAESIKGLALE